MICPDISEFFYKLKAWHGQHAPGVYPPVPQPAFGSGSGAETAGAAVDIVAPQSAAAAATTRGFSGRPWFSRLYRRMMVWYQARPGGCMPVFARFERTGERG